GPRALGFQWSAIRHALADLAESLGATPDEQLEQPIAQLTETSTAGVEEGGEHGAARRQLISAALSELAGAAARVSDRLALRPFSLVDPVLPRVTREAGALRRATRDALSLRSRGGAFAPAAAF